MGSAFIANTKVTVGAMSHCTFNMYRNKREREIKERERERKERERKQLIAVKRCNLLPCREISKKEL